MSFVIPAEERDRVRTPMFRDVEAFDRPAVAALVAAAEPFAAQWPTCEAGAFERVSGALASTDGDMVPCSLGDLEALRMRLNLPVPGVEDVPNRHEARQR